MPANTDFPEVNPQTGIILSLGNFNYNNDQEWATRLNHPRTGVAFGLINFGNPDDVGYAVSVLPFIEFDFFRKKRKDLKMHIGMGASYFNKKYDEETNPFNQGVTTNLTWSFRVFMYYDILQKQKTNWRIGAGYYHHSNGHTRLPNQGFNSFLISASTQIKYNTKRDILSNINNETLSFNNSSNSYFSLRTGIGQSVLSEDINDKREVYTIALKYGKVYNNTYKIGVGFYYRFYEHYYDYIVNDGELVTEMYPEFKENPFRNATTLGVSIDGELLLNHIGMFWQLGYNFSKPFYKVDWQLNQGYTYTIDTPNGPVQFTELGKLDSKYKAKSKVSSRLGLKYYLFGTKNMPKNNLFISAAINANLGQADFTELSLGYVYSFNFKDRK